MQAVRWYKPHKLIEQFVGSDSLGTKRRTVRKTRFSRIDRSPSATSYRLPHSLRSGGRPRHTRLKPKGTSTPIEAMWEFALVQVHQAFAASLPSGLTIDRTKEYTALVALMRVVFE